MSTPAKTSTDKRSSSPRTTGWMGFPSASCGVHERLPRLPQPACCMRCLARRRAWEGRRARRARSRSSLRGAQRRGVPCWEGRRDGGARVGEVGESYGQRTGRCPHGRGEWSRPLPDAAWPPATARKGACPEAVRTCDPRGGGGVPRRRCVRNGTGPARIPVVGIAGRPCWVVRWRLRDYCMTARARALRARREATSARRFILRATRTCAALRCSSASRSRSSICARASASWRRCMSRLLSGIVMWLSVTGTVGVSLGSGRVLGVRSVVTARGRSAGFTRRPPSCAGAHADACGPRPHPG